MPISYRLLSSILGMASDEESGKTFAFPVGKTKPAEESDLLDPGQQTDLPADDAKSSQEPGSNVPCSRKAYRIRLR